MSAAERQRRRRARERDGITVMPLAVPYYRFIEALQACERLTEAEGLDRQKVRAAAEEVLGDFIRRWLG